MQCFVCVNLGRASRDATAQKGKKVGSRSFSAEILFDTINERNDFVKYKFQDDVVL